MSEICCEECGEIIDWVSANEFFILFEKNNHKYLCFHCSGFDDHPCNDCRFHNKGGWLEDRCSLRNDSSFDLICIDKERLPDATGRGVESE